MAKAVWLVFEDQGWEGTHLLGIFSTRHKMLDSLNSQFTNVIVTTNQGIPYKAVVTDNCDHQLDLILARRKLDVYAG